ncbi:glycosyltransferase [Prosthecomicrobium pneumaticum]|uniref:Glycosyltransferase involved in cell wall biosynthesis n=1 Tax=Prosthecomicrobium pneumaticum TaxID=81895 RepID=A0A7W9FNQ6_9HYPH|nr:glycosyltransferase [Prosthecomicrobium pneumaticum]MBB5754075.1 glycosyltransferase involved in cell wall biosynthesis [Prosthecomicrobium pneumaticum]
MPSGPTQRLAIKARKFGRRWLGAPSWLERDSASGLVLSVDPPIIHTTLVWPESADYLWAFGSRVGRKPAAIVIYFSWHFDGGFASKRAVERVAAYRRAFPEHRVHFLANAQDEVDSLERFGEKGLLLNHNLSVSERFFFPIDDAEVAFDAVYNARLDVSKRVDLAFGIDRVAYVTRHYPAGDQTEAVRLQTLIEARSPAHRILNRVENGIVQGLDAEEVNRALNSAAVGLCLSPVEGVMLSSMEYMLAGLPVVSTPSTGGRDFFFDPDFCMIAPPTETAIREAVDTLRARRIPKRHVRDRTLAKLAPQRRGFQAFLDDVLADLGYPPRFGGAWPWSGRRNFSTWATVKDHFAAARQEPTAFPSGHGPRS